MARQWPKCKLLPLHSYRVSWTLVTPVAAWKLASKFQIAKFRSSRRTRRLRRDTADGKWRDFPRRSRSLMSCDLEMKPRYVRSRCARIQTGQIGSGIEEDTCRAAICPAEIRFSSYRSRSLTYKRAQSWFDPNHNREA